MSEIKKYLDDLNEPNKSICKRLSELIHSSLVNGVAKLYHASPVWFVDGNPIVGFSEKKGMISLLFWSGQSFTAPGLTPIGKFKAAEKVYSSVEGINAEELVVWLNESMSIQWDYKNIIKNKGQLSKL